MTTDENRLALFGDDLVDLILDVEKSFGISLDETDLVECDTIGALFDRIMSKVGTLGEPRCVSSVAFYRVRKALASMNGVPVKAIRPDSVLKTFLPRGIRRTSWRQLETTLRVKLPRMQPGQIIWIACAAALAMVLSLLRIDPRWGLWAVTDKLVLTLAGWLVLWILCLVVTQPLHREFPERIVTVGDLARAVVRHNHRQMAAEAGGTTSAQAWRSVQELISRRTGIDDAEIHADLRFPQDLGIF